MKIINISIYEDIAIVIRDICVISYFCGTWAYEDLQWIERNLETKILNFKKK